MVNFYFILAGGNIVLKKGNIYLFEIMDDQNISRMEFNDEWIIQCFWKGNSSGTLRPHSITFKRLSTTNNVTISGELFSTRSNDIFQRYHPTAPIQSYSILMKSGYSSVVIKVNRSIFAYASGFESMRVSVTITSASCVPVKECRPKEPATVHLLDLSNDLGRLLDPETSCFADVNLKCGDVSIPAHKNILSARSPVFAAMFRNPMKENCENEVVISDVDATVLRPMLVYVYTAKLTDLTIPSASDLLVAADKYQLGDLKKVCCEFLKDNTSLKNVLRMLFLGELYSNDLKSFAISFISDTCTELSILEKTEEWETLRKERPDLGMDVLTSMVKAKEEKGRE